jgi:hypothetical protein
MLISDLEKYCSKKALEKKFDKDVFLDFGFFL